MHTDPRTRRIWSLWIGTLGVIGLVVGTLLAVWLVSNGFSGRAILAMLLSEVIFTVAVILRVSLADRLR